MINPSDPIRSAREESNRRKPGRHTRRLCEKTDPQAAILGTKHCDIPYHTQQAILYILAHHESSTVRFGELRISSCGTTRTLILIACFPFRSTPRGKRARLLLNLSLKQIYITNSHQFSYSRIPATIW